MAKTRGDGQLRMPGLSLKVRGKSTRGPELSTFKIGALESAKFELDVDTDVIIQIVGPDGELICSQYGVCEGVAFKRHTPRQGRPWLERIHAITVGAPNE